MSSICTLEKLEDNLIRDLSWRKKELTLIKSFVSESTSELIEFTQIRSSINLLYAHWEGYIKRCCENYLEYVASSGAKISSLSSNFVAIAIRNTIKECGKSNKPSLHTDLVNRIQSEDYLADLILPHKDIIDTQSNLKSATLRELSCLLEFNYSIFELKENLIDNNLLKFRNMISHGNQASISRNEYYNMHDDIVVMLELFKDEIIKMSHEKKYLKS